MKMPAIVLCAALAACGGNGADPARPAVSEVGKAPDQPAAPGADVRARISEHYAKDLAACFVSNSESSSTVHLTFLVNEDGAVAYAVASATDNTALRTCVEQRALSWRLPAWRDEADNPRAIYYRIKVPFRARG